MTRSRSRYAALGAFLAVQPPTAREITLTFTAIEHLIGAPLPSGAFTTTFWTNSRATQQGRQWLTAGWWRERVDLRQAVPTVTFVRAETRA